MRRSAPRRRVHAIVAAAIAPAAVVALIAGCSTATMTAEQADRHAVDLVREMSAVIGVDPQRLMPSGNPANQCESELGRGYTGQVRFVHTFDARGLTLTDVPGRVQALAQHLGQIGFTPTAGGRYPGGTEYGNYGNERDEFLVSFEVAPDSVTLGANSPCVWPNGTPP